MRRMSKKCFFFTATPSPELRAIAGPENETVYPLAQAIEDGVCNSFDLRVMVVNGQRTPKVRSSKAHPCWEGPGIKVAYPLACGRARP